MGEAGNAAHQVRNYMSGKNNAETPELLIVDQLSAQIEAASRDMLSLIKHSHNIQHQIRNCIRCNNMALRTLVTNLPHYVSTKINKSECQTVIEYLETMRDLLSHVQMGKLII